MKHYGVKILAGFGLLLWPLLGLAESTPGGSDENPRNQLCFSAGYFANVHSNFYPVFQSGFAFSGAFYHDFRSRYGYEIRSGVRLVLHGAPDVDYMSFSPALLVTRKMLATHQLGWRIGVGPGLGMRDYAATYATGTYEEKRYHQTEFSLMAVGETGLDLYLGNFLLKWSAAFERHLTGDPSRGDFGDTGGFTFLFGLGLRL